MEKMPDATGTNAKAKKTPFAEKTPSFQTATREAMKCG
jgi:hypothetical protein